SDFAHHLTQMDSLSPKRLKALAKHNHFDYNGETAQELLEQKKLSFCFIIAGQGPKAYGMPEMFSPSQNLRHHQLLEATSILLTDGRYSGVTKGACIGHVTPEAFEGGAIGALKDGDILWLQLKNKKIDIMDAQAFDNGKTVYAEDILTSERKNLLDHRNKVATKRLYEIAACNVLADVTSAEKGVVPKMVDMRATIKIQRKK
ncbi:MAG: dihydroxy-acid dehydratase, partial [Alphaproteobacteria bacterium]